MTIIIPPGYSQFSVKIVLSAYNRAAYLTAGVKSDAANAQFVHDRVKTAFTTGSPSFLSQLDSNCSIQGIEARTVDSLGVESQFASNPVSVGTRAGSSPPPNIAVMVNKRSTRSGRRGRGRWYIPWFCNTADIGEDGTLLSGITTIQSVMTQMFNKFAADTIPLVILHNPSAPGTDHPTSPGTPDQLVGLLVSNTIATQRRRLARS